MNRRKFVKNSVAATAAASGVLLGRRNAYSSEGSEADTSFDQAFAHQPHRALGRTVTLSAKPSPIKFDPAKTVVMVVDMQNDFGSKGGMFDRDGFDISIIRRAIPPTAEVLAAARKAGIKIVYLKMGFRPDLSDMGVPDSPNWIGNRADAVGTTVRTPNGGEGRILVRDTWNTDIVDELKPEPTDFVMYKHRYSGFFETDLDAKLNRIGARYIIFTGCTTSVCVESTIRDAMFREYCPVLLADCAGEVVGSDLPRTNHDASLLLIEQRFGWISSSQEFIQALESAAKASA